MTKSCEKVFIGAKTAPTDSSTNYGDGWRREFRIEELIIHYKYETTKVVGRSKTVRKDYDIALIRLDYPIIDEKSGDNC